METTNGPIKEEIKTSIGETSREPNIIGNTDPANLAALHRAPGFNFNNFMLPEEIKSANNGNQKLTLDQFTRKVHSKQNLLYALSVKGKCARISDLRLFVHRSTSFARSALLHNGLPTRCSQRTQELLHQQRDTQGQSAAV